MVQNVILAIGAHPDDIEIGCAGTIRKHIIRGDTVHYVIASNGEKGGNGDDRVHEAKVAASMMGVHNMIFLNLPDTFISHDGHTVSLLDNTINSIKPNIIYVHSLKDYHQDHSNIAKAVLSASRNMKNSIFCYEAPSTTLEFTPNSFVDITQTFDKKMDCIRQFITQEKKDYVERQAVTNLSMFRGKVINVEYAEAFEVVRLIDF